MNSSAKPIVYSFFAPYAYRQIIRAVSAYTIPQLLRQINDNHQKDRLLLLYRTSPLVYNNKK